MDICRRNIPYAKARISELQEKLNKLTRGSEEYYKTLKAIESWESELRNYEYDYYKNL